MLYLQTGKFSHNPSWLCVTHLLISLASEMCVLCSKLCVCDNSACPPQPPLSEHLPTSSPCTVFKMVKDVLRSQTAEMLDDDCAYFP